MLFPWQNRLLLRPGSRVWSGFSLPSKEVGLIVLLSLIAYSGALKLGLFYDDFANAWYWLSVPTEVLLAHGHFNRLPIFLFIIYYPVLLALPLWLTHFIIIAVHTTSAIFIYKLLLRFKLEASIALVAALLFLIWPAHAEVLHWVVASTVVFGVCFVLGAVFLLLAKRYVWAALVASAGYTFYENIFLPGLLVHTVATFSARLTWRRRILYLLAHFFLYGLFQSVRWFFSGLDSVTRYETGFSHMKRNVVDLFFISLGLGSSRDTIWFWSRTWPTIPANVTQQLPWPFFGLGLLVAGLLLYLMLYFNRNKPGRFKPGVIGLTLGLSLGGYVSAFLVFLIIIGNSMNARYTYTSIPYLTVILAIGLTSLVHYRHRLVQGVGGLLTILVIGWALFQAWSSIEANWYPAWQVSQRIQQDVALTYRETGVKHIHLVNAPKNVGNGYALSRDWAYDSMARLYIDPDLELSAEKIPTFIQTTKQEAQANEAETFAKFQQGLLTFSESPCVFLGWQKGRRVVTEWAFTPDREYLLNCRTGLVEPSKEVSEAVLEYNLNLASQEVLKDFEY